MDKKQLSERDICTKFITPALENAGWQQSQFREEVPLTDGRVIVRGKLAAHIKAPNAPEEESHDPDILLEKYKKLLGEIEETENTLKSELAAALAHHFSDEVGA